MSAAPRPGPPSRRITGRELAAALAWAIGYEAAVLALSIAFTPAFGVHPGKVTGILVYWLLNVLSLPASLIVLLAGRPLEGWQSAVGLLGLNISAAAGVALYVIRRRARAHER